MQRKPSYRKEPEPVYAADPKKDERTWYVIGPPLRRHAVLPEVVCDVVGGPSSVDWGLNERTNVRKCHPKHVAYRVSWVKASTRSKKWQTFKKKRSI